MAQRVACPFCGYETTPQYAIQLHIEERHTDDSPFAVTKSDSLTPPLPVRPAPSISPSASSAERSDGGENPWIKCTRPQCGEYIAVTDLDEHYRFHEDIDTLQEESTSPRKRPPPREESTRSNHSQTSSPKRQRQRPQPPTRSSSSSTRSILDWITGSTSTPAVRLRSPRRHRTQPPRQPGRLGRRELGPHAFESRMPSSVRDLLSTGPELTRRIQPDTTLSHDLHAANETRGIIPILADLCATDRSTVATYLCHPSVRHIAKLRCDGNFCGYWNIQMLLSHLDATRPPRNGRQRPTPTVLQIQDDIERAWDNGICAYGRVETGGVRGTRKWIGTHEALAYFTQIGVEVEALTFREDSNIDKPAVLSLLDHLEAYFISALSNPQTQHHGSSHTTPLPPLYFQRFGHSMTIVGVERKGNGERNLLVFDSSFATTAAMGRLVAGRKTIAWPEALLKAYRRSDTSLSRWGEFEIVVPRVQYVGSEGMR